MRKLTFDQFEFEHPDSEESLELWIAAKGSFPFPDVRSFVASVATIEIAEKLGSAQPFDEVFYREMVRQYLARFAGLIIPQLCVWPTYELFNDALDWDAVLEASDLFIRFHWWSTA